MDGLVSLRERANERSSTNFSRRTNQLRKKKENKRVTYVDLLAITGILLVYINKNQPRYPSAGHVVRVHHPADS